jgi:DNA recombination protein RmuC
LAVIRQAVDNFSLSKTTSQIMTLFGEFNKQWLAFKDGMDKMGRKIEETSKEFNDLATTRTKTLERSLKRIDEIRSQQLNAESTTQIPEKINNQEKDQKPAIGPGVD